MYQPSLQNYSQDDDIQEIAVITPLTVQEIHDQVKQKINQSPTKSKDKEENILNVAGAQIKKAPVIVPYSIDEIHKQVKARMLEKTQNENNNMSNCNSVKRKKLSLSTRHDKKFHSSTSVEKSNDTSSILPCDGRRSPSPEIVILEEVSKQQKKSTGTKAVIKTPKSTAKVNLSPPTVSTALIAKALQITDSLTIQRVSVSSQKTLTPHRKTPPTPTSQLKSAASTSSASLAVPSTSGLPPGTPTRILEVTPQKQGPSTSTPLIMPISGTPKTGMKRLWQEDIGTENSPLATPSKIALEAEAELLPKYENLKIFKLILTEVWACKKNMHLFDSQDLHCFALFQDLSEEAKLLYVQLLKMKHQWRRVSTIKYDDIRPDLLPVIKELVVQNFLEDSEALVDLRTMLELLKIQEIKLLMNIFHIPITGRTKATMIDALISCGKTQRSIFPTANGSPDKKNVTSAISDRVKNMLGPCIRLQSDCAQTLQRVYLLGSLPSCFADENLSTFIFRIYKSLREFTIYPKIQIERSQVIFRNKASLVKFQKSYNMYMDAIKCTQNKGWDETIGIAQEAWAMFKELQNNIELREHDKNLPQYLRRFSAGEVLVSILKLGLDAMGRRKQYSVIVELLRDLLDQDIYKTRHRGFWYERLALTLHVHNKNLDQAADAVIAAMSDTQVHLISKLALCNRASQLLSRKTWKPSPNVKLSLLKFSAPLVQEPPSRNITARSRVGQGQGLKLDYIHEGTDGDAVVVSSVEELAISYYKRAEGFTEGVHAEGTLIASLFGILFWDVIYEHFVPDTFLSKYQESPLDLSSRDFYLHRTAAIESRLAEIESWTDLQAQIFIQGIWEQHAGKLSVVSWKIFRDMQQAQDLLVCIGMKAMTGICRRLCEEYRVARSGFPDIALWKPGEQDKMCKFVEVKGPNDHLSNKQRVWIDYLIKFGVDVEVCYVKTVSEKYLGATS